MTSSAAGSMQSPGSKVRAKSGLNRSILDQGWALEAIYAVFNRERIIAPGILYYDELMDVYRYDQIDAQTDVYGVIGDPVGHSLSPLLHNTAFARQKVNAVYLPFQVPAGQLPSFLQGFDRVGHRRAGQAEVVGRQGEAAPLHDPGEHAHGVEAIHCPHSRIMMSDCR